MKSRDDISNFKSSYTTRSFFDLWLLHRPYAAARYTTEILPRHILNIGVTYLQLSTAYFSFVIQKSLLDHQDVLAASTVSRQVVLQPSIVTLALTHSLILGAPVSILTSVNPPVGSQHVGHIVYSTAYSMGMAVSVHPNELQFRRVSKELHSLNKDVS